jgi:hypothetical protein
MLKNLQNLALWGIIFGALPALVLFVNEYTTVQLAAGWSVRRITILDDVFYWVGVLCAGPVLFMVGGAIHALVSQKRPEKYFQ